MSTLNGDLLERSLLFWLSIQDLGRLDAADTHSHSSILSSPAWEECAVQGLVGFSIAPGSLSSSEPSPVSSCDFQERRRKFNRVIAALRLVTVAGVAQVFVPDRFAAQELLSAVQRANRIASAHAASKGSTASVLVGQVSFPVASMLIPGRVATLVPSKPMSFTMPGNTEKAEAPGTFKLWFAWDSSTMYISASCLSQDRSRRWYMRRRMRSISSDVDETDSESSDEDAFVPNPHNKRTLAIDVCVVWQGASSPVIVCTRDTMVTVGGDWCKARGIACPGLGSSRQSGLRESRAAFSSALVSGLTFVVCVRPAIPEPPAEGALDRIASLNLEAPIYR